MEEFKVIEDIDKFDFLTNYAKSRGIFNLGDLSSGHARIETYPRIDNYNTDLLGYKHVVKGCMSHASEGDSSKDYDLEDYDFIANGVYAADVNARRAANITRSIESAGHKIVKLQCAYSPVHERGGNSLANNILRTNKFSRCISKSTIDSRYGLMGGMSFVIKGIPDWVFTIRYNYFESTIFPRAGEYAKYGKSAYRCNAGYAGDSSTTPQSGVSWDLKPVGLAMIHPEAATMSGLTNPIFCGNDTISGVIDSILNTIEHLLALGRDKANEELFLGDTYTATVREMSEETRRYGNISVRAVATICRRSNEDHRGSRRDGIPTTEGRFSSNYGNPDVLSAAYNLTNTNNFFNPDTFRARLGFVKSMDSIATSFSSMSEYSRKEYIKSILDDGDRISSVLGKMIELGDSLLKEALKNVWRLYMSSESSGSYADYTGIALIRGISIEDRSCPVTGIIPKASSRTGVLDGPLYYLYLIPKRTGSGIPVVTDPRVPATIIRDATGRVIHNPRNYTTTNLDPDEGDGLDEHTRNTQRITEHLRSELIFQVRDSSIGNFIKALEDEFSIPHSVHNHGHVTCESPVVRGFVRALIDPWLTADFFSVVKRAGNDDVATPAPPASYANIPDTIKLEYIERGLLRVTPPIQEILRMSGDLCIGDFSEYAPAADPGRRRSANKARKKAKATQNKELHKTQEFLRKESLRAKKRLARRRRNHPGGDGIIMGGYTTSYTYSTKCSRPYGPSSGFVNLTTASGNYDLFV